MARDLREEYRHVVEELKLTNLQNLSYETRVKLFLLKQKIVVLLMAIVFEWKECEYRSVELIMIFYLFLRSQWNDGQPMKTKVKWVRQGEMSCSQNERKWNDEYNKEDR